MADHDDTLHRLHHLGTQPIEPGRSAHDLVAMAAVRPARGLGGKLRLAGAFLAGLLIGSTGLAAADALPDPAQHVAHTVLDRVGVQVPDPERYHGPECGPEAKRNHGAYVRDDHTLARSDCGKKTKAAGAGESDDDHGRAPEATRGPKAPKGPCQGRPPWAGNETMTAEERAAAQAEREAQCGVGDPAEAETDAPASTEADAPTDAPVEADPDDPPAETGTDAPLETDPVEPEAPSGVG